MKKKKINVKNKQIFSQYKCIEKPFVFSIKDFVIRGKYDREKFRILIDYSMQLMIDSQSL